MESKPTDPAAVRVDIATEVLELLDDDFFEPAQGKFVIKPDPHGSILEDVRYSEFIPEHMLSRQLGEIVARGCEVCAAGALFIAAIRRYDQYSLGDFVRSTGSRLALDRVEHSELWPYMKRHFEGGQLALIEWTFEGRTSTTHAMREIYEVPQRQWVEAFAFQDKVRDQQRPGAPLRRVLRAIMENIIEHNGEFVPPKLTDKEVCQVCHDQEMGIPADLSALYHEMFLHEESDEGSSVDDDELGADGDAGE